MHILRENGEAMIAVLGANVSPCLVPAECKGTEHISHVAKI